MAQDVKVSKTIKWGEVVTRTSTDSGIPKKQLEEDMGQITETLAKLSEENRPQKIGTATVIYTPIGVMKLTRVPAEVRIDNATGKKVERDECVAVAIAANTKFIDAANIGLVAGAVDAKEEKKSKKAS